jgi:hypothetical protein
MVDQCFFLLEALTQVDNNIWWSSTAPNLCVSSFVWTTHWATNGSTSRFHLKALTPSYPFHHAFRWDTRSPLCLNFIMLWFKGEHLVYNSTNFPNLSIIFSNFFHNTLYTTWVTPSFNCKHPLLCVHTSHWPYGYPLLMLHSWQRMHQNPWCNLWHLCCHCIRCWLPCGTRTITCTSFNYIQLLLSTNQHCAHQRWHLHPSRYSHCQPNTNIFTFLILCNSKICCLWCNWSEGKELSQLTPHWSILSFNNWNILLLTQTY